MAILDIGSLVQVQAQSDLREAVVTEIDGPYCEVVYTDGLESDPQWVLSCGLTKVHEKKYKQRFEEPARGMYAKIPFRSGLMWATILTVGANYTLVSYEDNTTVDYVLTGCLKDCFMKTKHPTVKVETGDLVHIAMNSDFGWAYVTSVDEDYVKLVHGNTGKVDYILRQSIVAKTDKGKDAKVKKTVKRRKRSCVIL